MPTPTNKALYERVKKEIYKKNPKHSAYRSGMVVKEYKKRGGKYSGSKKNTGLTRWFKEDWKNQRGKTGYSKKGDYYRPTKRITKDTPKTHKELTPAQKAKAKKNKAKGKTADFKSKK